jgi:hypothetical protein
VTISPKISNKNGWCMIGAFYILHIFDGIQSGHIKYFMFIQWVIYSWGILYTLGLYIYMGCMAGGYYILHIYVLGVVGGIMYIGYCMMMGCAIIFIYKNVAGVFGAYYIL